MMKESLDGYIMDKDYKLEVRTVRGKDIVDIKLHHDYETTHPTT